MAIELPIPGSGIPRDCEPLRRRCVNLAGGYRVMIALLADQGMTVDAAHSAAHAVATAATLARACRSGSVVPRMSASAATRAVSAVHSGRPGGASIIAMPLAMVITSAGLLELSCQLYTPQNHAETTQPISPGTRLWRSAGARRSRSRRHRGPLRRGCRARLRSRASRRRLRRPARLQRLRPDQGEHRRHGVVRARVGAPNGPRSVAALPTVSAGRPGHPKDTTCEQPSVTKTKTSGA